MGDSAINFQVDQDFDNDGYNDFVGYGTGIIWGGSNGTVRSSISQIVATGDFNADGCTDLVTTAGYGTTLYFPFLDVCN